MIYVIAELRLKPGTAEKACAEACKVVAGTVKEDGCIGYDFHLSVSDPTRLVAVERWESREALDPPPGYAASAGLARRRQGIRRRPRRADHHAGKDRHVVSEGVRAARDRHQAVRRMGRRLRRATASCSTPATATGGASCSKGEQGTEFLLDFEKPVTLHDGDGLALDDGTIVLVAGAPEALIEVSAHSALDTVRLAWHLGNRHTDVQIVGDKIAAAARPRAGGYAARLGRASRRRSRRRSIRKQPRRMGMSMGDESWRVNKTRAIAPLVPAQAGTREALAKASRVTGLRRF